MRKLQFPHNPPPPHKCAKIQQLQIEAVERIAPARLNIFIELLYLNFVINSTQTFLSLAQVQASPAGAEMSTTMHAALDWLI